MFNLQLYLISNLSIDKKPSSTSSTSTTTRGTTSTTSTTRATTTSAPSSRRPGQSWPNIDRPLLPSRGPPLISLIPISSSTTPPSQPSYINTRRPSIVSTSFSTTTTTTTRKPTVKSRTTRPNLNVVRTQDNEINDSLLKPNNKAATARLNMGGIIALGVFGGFVFLAAVITIVVIIVRR
jgi:hypothetical protein